MSEDTLVVWCENVWCALEYVQTDGWGGLCPSCVALVDEHLASGHGPTRECRECRECQRAGARPAPEHAVG